MTECIDITKRIKIPVAEISFRFARSGGRGGQNVNKVETRVELIFDVSRSPSLSDSDRLRVYTALGGRIGSDGLLRIVSQESRSQWKNRELAVSRFAELLGQALRPVKKRVRIKAPAAMKERRLENKKRRGDIKKFRRRPEF